MYKFMEIFLSLWIQSSKTSESVPKIGAIENIFHYKKGIYQNTTVKATWIF